VGLLATTQARLYSSAFYALRDTRTPLRFGVLRVLLVTALGYAAAFPVREALGVDGRWGPAGLTISAGIAGWLEFLLLQRAMSARIGKTGLRVGELARLWLAAGAGAALAWLALTFGHGLTGVWRVTLDGVVLVLFALGYLGSAHLLRIPHAARVLARLRPGSGDTRQE
jgi:putative peptidoglycan lipid II flippase